jgi:acyl-ACP thioesterase
MEDGTVCTENVIQTPADKVQMPKDIETVHVMDHVVAYSDVDMNAHTNNAMYMQWAMDAVDYDIASTMPVREFTINFNHETKPGDVVSIYKARIIEDEGRRVYVEGKVDGQSAFCVEIVF